MIRLLSFLGNKGSTYRNTRHNSGWLFLNHLLETLETSSWQKKFHGEYIKSTIEGLPVFLLKPLTFMNKSGESIAQMAHYFSIETDEILLVHDDIELPFGKIQLQYGGGLAGHNGLKSVKQHLGSSDFFRLRIGVGRPKQQEVSSFVLSKFSLDEEVFLPLLFSKTERLLREWLKEGCKTEQLPKVYQ